jgi:hypothetical protein
LREELDVGTEEKEALDRHAQVLEGQNAEVCAELESFV